ncbi:unnamed protein product [Rotaria sordida]|uniref:GT23 domain-containing protein n=1 Tax=Rotaria sordida TaxID=392033 RepID=A0A818UA42_9BILA|nr:unnamed protein product [Rotaria sordida]CAF3695006.1 unnamed protein product [Rotaria sordida]
MIVVMNIVLLMKTKTKKYIVVIIILIIEYAVALNLLSVMIQLFSIKTGTKLNFLYNGFLVVRKQYNPGGFEEIFQSPMHNCIISMISNASSWAKFTFIIIEKENLNILIDSYETADVVDISSIDAIHPREDFLPVAIPEDISQRLIRLHGNPFVLVHIRRTDKIDLESAFHDLSEYMKNAEDYYIIYQYQNPDLKFIKLVYLASDDPSVFNETRTNYLDYVFYGDAAATQSAQPNSRYRTESLKDILFDIHFLSLCDYLVCTFSSKKEFSKIGKIKIFSNVTIVRICLNLGLSCRVAYDVMQQRVVDGAWRVQSLDDIYYFGGQSLHNQRAVISHKSIPRNKFSFERGDIISLEGDHWNGFSKGSDNTNYLTGLYPSYKTEEIVNIAKMYTYPGIQIKDDDF